MPRVRVASITVLGSLGIVLGATPDPRRICPERQGNAGRAAIAAIAAFTDVQAGAQSATQSR